MSPKKKHYKEHTVLLLVLSLCIVLVCLFLFSSFYFKKICRWAFCYSASACRMGCSCLCAKPAPLLSSTSKPSASELALGKHLVVFNSTCRSWITQAQIPPAEPSPTGTSQRGAFPESSQEKMVRLEHGNPAVGWSRGRELLLGGKSLELSKSGEHSWVHLSSPIHPLPHDPFPHRNKKQNKIPMPFR